MPETCENRLGLINSLFTMSARPMKFIYQVLANLMGFKAPGNFEIH